MFDLNGKVALVTGAARGLGLAYAKQFLQNGLKGVALIDVDIVNGKKSVDQLTNEFGKDKAIFINADVSDTAQLRESFETTIRTFNQLDIVVNNAGIIQERQWERCVAINLGGVISGTIMAMDEYLPKYRSGAEGVIVNTASMVGLQPFEETPTYAGTKFGVVGFTRAMGGDVHYQTTKVRVIAICPGVMDTALIAISKEQVPEPYISIMQNTIKNLVAEKPEVLAKYVMNVIKESSTGSVWLLMNDSCTQVEFPVFF